MKKLISLVVLLSSCEAQKYINAPKREICSDAIKINSLNLGTFPVTWEITNKKDKDYFYNCKINDSIYYLSKMENKRNRYNYILYVNSDSSYVVEKFFYTIDYLDKFECFFSKNLRIDRRIIFRRSNVLKTYQKHITSYINCEIFYDKFAITGSIPSVNFQLPFKEFFTNLDFLKQQIILKDTIFYDSKELYQLQTFAIYQ